MKLTQKELIAEVQNHLSKTHGTALGAVDIKRVLSSLEHIATTAFQAGKEVTLPGIGKFKVAVRAPRTGRNPQTGEAIAIAAKNVVKFSVSKPLSDALN